MSHSRTVSVHVHSRGICRERDGVLVLVVGPPSTLIPSRVQSTVPCVFCLLHYALCAENMTEASALVPICRIVLYVIQGRWLTSVGSVQYCRGGGEKGLK